ncbi:SWIM zinc finger family protein [Paenibacillus donghaensis]|uniref:SWIM-type domain-containing protein n=1 Tax=Paenibacillus donghaensis TaxID=414771 RepID=A0A2Z2KLL6_9BACL|nr:SWIM zinc finger family protein [Paenibacillus donghaensis]ASA25215.1 hypothetical protein B9T62_33475 [Paenibacillus donghaensis]
MEKLNDYTLDDNRWNWLIQNVAYCFDDLTLKRGFQYYKQRRVRTMRSNEFGPPGLKAIVEGREDYVVSVDLTDLRLGRCNCPVGGPCKHMAALLMCYAEQQNRSVNMLANAKAAVIRTVQDSGSDSGGASRRPTKQQLKQLAKQLGSATVTQWREYFATAVAPLAQSVRNSQYVEKALAAITEYQPELGPAATLLFQLNSRLYVLETLIPGTGISSLPQGYGSSLGYYTQIAVSDLQEYIGEHLLEQDLPLNSEPDQFTRLMDTVALLRQAMLTETRGRRDEPPFSLFYSLVWDNWIAYYTAEPEVYLNEISLLRQAEAELGAALSKNSWRLAQGRMYFYLEDDLAAWEFLQLAAEQPGIQPGEWMDFIEIIIADEEWDRLVDWLVRIGPQLNKHYYSLKRYSECWEEALSHLPEEEPRMWSTLTEMLPFSRDLYDEKLLGRGKWQEWMDYQISSGAAPSDFRVRDLQPLEKHAPELLLPFYHQAVERFVIEKNRDSYKAAVKLLKRLAKLYKKIKREERWELFLSSFTAKHSRLRALQEELRKGNLIS